MNCSISKVLGQLHEPNFHNGQECKQGTGMARVANRHGRLYTPDRISAYVKTVLHALTINGNPMKFASPHPIDLVELYVPTKFHGNQLGFMRIRRVWHNVSPTYNNLNK